MPTLRMLSEWINGNAERIKPNIIKDDQILSAMKLLTSRHQNNRIQNYISICEALLDAELEISPQYFSREQKIQYYLRIVFLRMQLLEAEMYEKSNYKEVVRSLKSLTIELSQINISTLPSDDDKYSSRTSNAIDTFETMLASVENNTPFNWCMEI
jgi:hypothetical protein